ncbi:hypothetical protein [Phocaeicola vulgatus]|uniref:Uncharacterized protein n=2 Tax=Bacteroidaceae TaxID=815 RepID=A0A069S2S1_PHOVU|nr:hypothetical protein [Phocaeicola vulgatus]KDS44340.1 hypothetical protein M099_4284 [Phocaeicola vulgatus str. 3975 RP4]MDB0805745.1 hypothetical protein [Phocaeicola vulgatus]MDB0822643.1 hypothetical protein [Phocaeicola vulgatus]MDB1068002.1 hypothetical protein [Phocaeicola vulgatus]MDB1072334.1 hypothetical protein [Phocaeicola vulgatus]
MPKKGGTAIPLKGGWEELRERKDKNKALPYCSLPWVAESARLPC